MPRSGFVRRHEAAFRDFHIFLVGALVRQCVAMMVMMMVVMLIIMYDVNDKSDDDHHRDMCCRRMSLLDSALHYIGPV